MKKSIVPLKDAKKIIVRLPNFLGDSIMTTPALGLLFQEYPNAKFTFICNNPSQEIFGKLTVAEKLIIDDTKKGRGRFFKTIRLIKNIRQENYDLGVLFHNSFVNALILKSCKVKRLIGYNNESRWFLLDFYLKINRTRHYINHYANLVNQYLGNKYSHLPSLAVWNKGEEVDFGFANDLPVVGLGLGNDVQGSRAYTKKLSLELIHLLLETHQYNLVLIGDKNDAKRNNFYLDQIPKELKARILNYSGKTDVGTHINIIKNLDVLITIDSSAMHIAAAVLTPFIVLLGKSTSAFSTVQPKVSFGRYLKKERNLIDDDQFISQIEPSEILEELQAIVQERCKFEM